VWKLELKSLFFLWERVMSRSIVFAAAVFFAIGPTGMIRAAEPAASAAGWKRAPNPAPDWQTIAATLHAYQYFYRDFPRQVQALEYERQLAEADAVYVARRVNSFRPFRSFHQYGATYFVDQAWQIEWLAAQQRLDCLSTSQADLWQHRQAMAALYLIRGY
jgi:hypothetical protein